jgi:hypothetical protein
MDNLFSHPGFRLIFVGDDNMSLITPLDHQEDVIEKGYRCISHYWGPCPPKWEDHPIKGVHWSVHVREEKRERLLQVFNHHKGYFWMDVFCTNQEDVNKPLDVMGDIYKNCVECVCLLDYECKLGVYGTEKDVFVQLNKDGEIMYDEDDYNPVISSYLSAISSSKWFTRLWTWQESVLPPNVVFCSELSGVYKYTPIGRELIPHVGLKSNRYSYDRYGPVEQVLLRLLNTFWSEKKDTLSVMREVLECRRFCTNEEDNIYSICGLLRMQISPNLNLVDARKELLDLLWERGYFFEHGTGIFKGTLGSMFGFRNACEGINYIQNLDLKGLNCINCGEILFKVHIKEQVDENIEITKEQLLCMEKTFIHTKASEKLMQITTTSAMDVTINGISKNIANGIIWEYFYEIEDIPGDFRGRTRSINKYIYVTTEGYLVVKKELKHTVGDILKIGYIGKYNEKILWIVERMDCGKGKILGEFYKKKISME